MNKIISTFIKVGFIAAGLMGEVTLNAWWCEHCNRPHSGRCPVTGHTEHGRCDGTLPPFRIVGQTSDGYPVRQYDGSPGLMAAGPDYQVNNYVIDIGGRFFYYDNGVMCDGLGDVYDKHGAPLQPVGQLADGNLVYPQVVDVEYIDQNYRFVTPKGNRTAQVIQLRNGHFAYAFFNARRVNHEYYFDGQEHVDLDGHAWDGKGKLVDLLGNVVKR
ncbi:MAG: hypothetical protein LBJ78_03795 [Puniceicoccales bacterium]|jgi:hypothetical protein|nr:hypothetical protein [Puniceicoccales bacterium]